MLILLFGEAPVAEAGILPNLHEEPESGDGDSRDELDWTFAAGMSVSQPKLSWTDSSGEGLTAHPYVVTWRMESTVERDRCACPVARGVVGASLGMDENDLLFLGLEVGILLTAPVLTWGYRDYGISVGAEALLDAGTWFTGDSSMDAESPNGMTGSLRAVASLRIARKTSLRLHLPIVQFGDDSIVPSLGVGMVLEP